MSVLKSPMLADNKFGFTAPKTCHYNAALFALLPLVLPATHMWLRGYA